MSFTSFAVVAPCGPQPNKHNKCFAFVLWFFWWRVDGDKGANVIDSSGPTRLPRALEIIEHEEQRAGPGPVRRNLSWAKAISHLSSRTNHSRLTSLMCRAHPSLSPFNPRRGSARSGVIITRVVARVKYDPIDPLLLRAPRRACVVPRRL